MEQDRWDDLMRCVVSCMNNDSTVIREASDRAFEWLMKEVPVIGD